MKYAIAFFLLLAPMAAQAQLFKCVSKSGKVEYATQCPEGTTAQQTGIRSSTGGPSSTSTATKPKSAAEQEADFRKRQAEGAEAASKQQKEAAEQAQKQTACNEARSYLAGLQSGARITRTDPKTGERTFLDDNARAQEVTRAQQSVQANCGK